MRFFICASLSLFLVGCADYSSRVRRSREYLELGSYELAIEGLSELAKKKDNDELLYLLDLGIAYHAAGRYREAVTTFLKAEELAQLNDYTSVTGEVGAVIFNDTVQKYSGEDFEKVLVNVYLAIDFTLLKEWDSALVECRKVNQKIETMITKGKLPYQYNAFAKYLAASLFETRRETNSAFVDYRMLLKWNYEAFPYLPGPLMKVADRLQATEELADYRKRFPGSDYRLKKGEGEIILLLEQGRTPIKIPSEEFRLVPRFQKQAYFAEFAKIHRENHSESFRTMPLYDIEARAIDELDQRIAGMVAKKIAGVVVKETAAYGVKKATNSEVLGALTSIFLHLSDKADLRSWTTLPARLQLARFTLPAGRHNIVLDMVEFTGTERKSARRWDGVEVKPGEITYLHHRAIF